MPRRWAAASRKRDCAPRNGDRTRIHAAGHRADHEHHGDRSRRPASLPRPKPEAAETSHRQRRAVVTAASSTETAGVEKSALYKINADNTVETLWSSKEENAYDLVVSGGRPGNFVTDAQGRIYRLDRDRKTTLIAQANEGEATRLLESPGGLHRGDRQSRKDFAAQRRPRRERMVRIAGA